MEEKINIIVSQLGDLRVKRNVDLTEYVFLQPAGLASAVFIATSIAELIKAVSLCRELKLPFIVIGSGSKVSNLGSGFSGLVIKNRSQNLKIFGVKGKVSRSGIGIKEAFIEADSGATLSDVADYTLKQGLAGFEDLKLTKGTIGGSVLNNPTLLDNVTQIKVLNNSDVTFTKDKNEVSSKDIILKSVFHLKAREV